MNIGRFADEMDREGCQLQTGYRGQFQSRRIAEKADA